MDNRLEENTDETSTERPDVVAELKIPCEVYSRVVGYLRPVESWNAAKQLEFEERKKFDLNKLEDDDAELPLHTS